MAKLSITRTLAFVATTDPERERFMKKPSA